MRQNNKYTKQISIIKRLKAVTLPWVNFFENVSICKIRCSASAQKTCLNHSEWSSPRNIMHTTVEYGMVYEHRGGMKTRQPKSIINVKNIHNLEIVPSMTHTPYFCVAWAVRWCIVRPFDIIYREVTNGDVYVEMILSLRLINAQTTIRLSYIFILNVAYMYACMYVWYQYVIIYVYHHHPVTI